MSSLLDDLLDINISIWLTLPRVRGKINRSNTHPPGRIRDQFQSERFHEKESRIPLLYEEVLS